MAVGRHWTNPFKQSQHTTKVAEIYMEGQELCIKDMGIG